MPRDKYRGCSVQSATWERTWFNKNEGVRYCLWHATDAGALKEIFSDLDITWDSIVEVEETIPDIWKASDMLILFSLVKHGSVN